MTDNPTQINVDEERRSDTKSMIAAYCSKLAEEASTNDEPDAPFGEGLSSGTLSILASIGYDVDDPDTQAVVDALGLKFVERPWGDED